MRKIDFEEYLMETHAELHPTILDDDLIDAYQDWVCGLDIEDTIKYANDYARRQYCNGFMDSKSDHFAIPGGRPIPIGIRLVNNKE